MTKSKLRKTRNDSDEQGRVTRAAGYSEQTHGATFKASFLGAVALTAVILAFLLYGPALDGPFLFDDLGLPFYLPSFAQHSIDAWLTGVRPVLMLSYWVNFQISAREPWTYHALNVILHSFNAVLVFVLLIRVLRIQFVDARRSFACAAIASSIFLVHPLQTEAVAYIAGRSELVCGFFVLAALAVYCNPGLDKVTWQTAALVLLLYGAAILSKEQAVVLPGVFLVVDVVFRRLSVREALNRGAWLYRPIAVVAVFAILDVAGQLARSATAGFNIPGMRWYDYLFTQFRVWPLYLGLAVLPFRQNADYDIALSHSLAEHGSGLALAALLLVAFAAWRVRERFPLLFGGALTFAILLAPTSSLVPIQDVAAERRMYIPLLGLLLILIQALVSLKFTHTVIASLVGYVLTCSALTYERAKVWGSDVAFWSDTTARSPEKSRGYTHLTYAYIRARRCPEAVKTALRTPEKFRGAPEFLGMLGHAYACEQRMAEAVNAFERAVLVGPSVGRFLALASTYRQAGRLWDAQAAEQQAMRLTPQTPYDFNMLDSFMRTKTQSRSRSAPIRVDR